jgi:hypothetical protein
MLWNIYFRKNNYKKQLFRHSKFLTMHTIFFSGIETENVYLA